MHIIGKASARKPSGTFIEINADGSIIERDTRQCCHCNRHWIVRPGSGAQRGFCYSCSTHVCGRPECMIFCNPFEKQLDQYEKGIIKVLR